MNIVSCIFIVIIKGKKPSNKKTKQTKFTWYTEVTYKQNIQWNTHSLYVHIDFKLCTWIKLVLHIQTRAPMDGCRRFTTFVTQQHFKLTYFLKPQSLYCRTSWRRRDRLSLTPSQMYPKQVLQLFFKNNSASKLT